MSQKRKLRTSDVRVARPVLKRKRRPRGKPFAKGNRHGIAHRFPPGVSGNAGGRPSYKAVSEALRYLLELPIDDLRRFVPKTAAEKAAHGAVAEATKKKLGWFSEICDRTEGRPTVAVHFDEHDPLADIVKSLDVISARIGGPENEDMPEDKEEE